MSPPDIQDWSELPEHVLEDIMLMVGVSLESCRQVCRAWNVVIMRKLWESPTKKWATIIQRRIERSWTIQGNYPSAKQISKAKLLGR